MCRSRPISLPTKATDTPDWSCRFESYRVESRRHEANRAESRRVESNWVSKPNRVGSGKSKYNYCNFRAVKLLESALFFHGVRACVGHVRFFCRLKLRVLCIRVETSLIVMNLVEFWRNLYHLWVEYRLSITVERCFCFFFLCIFTLKQLQPVITVNFFDFPVSYGIS